MKKKEERGKKKEGIRIRQRLSSFFFILSSLFLFLFSIKIAHAQPIPRAVLAGYALNSEPLPLRDSVPLFEKQAAQSEGSRKSPFLAAGLSAIVPGLGEYYCGEQIWRGMIFTGLEIGLWAEYFHYNARGADSTAAFRSFSDAHFSTCRYVSHMDSILTSDTSRARAAHNYLADCRDSASIHRAEAYLDSLSNYGTDPTIKDFGHRLILNDPQQYYEMISKYVQYIPGWDQIGNWNAASDMRDRMNFQYGVAQGMIWGVIINHILSAVDAALLANDHNSKLRLHGDLILKPYPNGSLGYVPTANMQLTF